MLHAHRMRWRWPRVVERVGERAALPLERLHSGHVGDYAAWLVVGAGAFGGLFSLMLR